MKNSVSTLVLLVCLFSAHFSIAQDSLSNDSYSDDSWRRSHSHDSFNRRERRNQDIQTVFRRGHSSGGYGALTNRFTTINGQFANLSGIYGGWYVNHWFMIGLEATAMTNNMPVPIQYSADPARDLSYEYGQFGLMTEYVIGSRRAVHLAFSFFSGAGFTLQYQRYGHNNFNYDGKQTREENWFFVAEPGVQLEINLTRWMRLSPGVSYRATFGSDAAGLKDKDLSNVSYNATLKFGRF